MSEEEIETCDGTTPSVQQFMRSECGSSGCHGGSDPAATLSLSGTSILDTLVGTQSGTCEGWMLVVPGRPESSFLWHKLYSAEPACGETMPPRHPLKAVQLQCIRQWIESLPEFDAGPGCETCGGTECIDLTNDPTHCGSCGVACPAGAGCTNGSCECGDNLRFCSGACVDVQADAAHCGDCDSACPTGALCNVGQCVCTGGLEACENACVELRSDPQNCGSCGNACAAADVCLEGSCASDCGALTQCGASCRDTQTSVLSCGACDAICPTGASCVSGQCLCPAGTSVCGSACINTFSDPSNCGGCGVACSGGLVCEAGACKCPGGGARCGTQCVEIATDVRNCGGCGVVCALGQTCTEGACTCSSATATFSADVQPIFTASCAARGCHSGLRPAEGMDLTATKSYASIVGVRSKQCTDGRLRVAPGDPARSYLMHKLMDVNVCFGTQMPKAGNSLPRAQIETIAAWICGGAQQN